MDDTLDYDQLIRNELSEWKKLGITDPAQVVMSNTFLMNVKLVSLTKLLIDKGILEEADIELEFKKEMIIQLQEAREGMKMARTAMITKGITH